MLHYISVVNPLGIARTQIKFLTLMHRQLSDWKNYQMLDEFNLEYGENTYRV